MNSGCYIGQTIQSVLGQDYPFIEHVIVDGGSTDGTVDILRRYNERTTWVSRPDKGQSDALNKGFRMARGEIVGWLNADDTYEPDAVRQSVECLLDHPEAALVYGDCNLLHDNGDLYKVWKSYPCKFEDLFLNGCVFAQQTAFFRRRALDKVGGWNNSLNYAMDYDLWLRLSKQYPFVYLPGARASFRLASGSKSMSAPLAFWPEIAAILDQFVAGDDALNSELVSEAYRRLYIQAGAASVLNGDVSQGEEYLRKAFADNACYPGSWATLAEYIFEVCHGSGYGLHDDQKSAQLLELILTYVTKTKRMRAMIPHIQALRSFRAYSQGDAKSVRRFAWRALITSSDLRRNRGLLSIYLESIFGGRAMSWWRGYRHPLRSAGQ